MHQSKLLHSAITFFLYLLVFTALGFTVFAITSFFLLFIFHDTRIAIQDLKFPIATFIIMSPIFIILANYIEKQIKSERIKLDNPIRIFFIYINISIIILLMISILIMVILFYLNGYPVSIRLFWGLITTLFMGGLVLLYNIYDVRRKSITQNPNFKFFFNIISGFLLFVTCIIIFLLVTHIY